MIKHVRHTCLMPYLATAIPHVVSGNLHNDTHATSQVKPEKDLDSKFIVG